MKPPSTGAHARLWPNDLHAYCVEAMVKCGFNREDAGLAATVLVTTDTWGIHTHGVAALRGYLRRTRAGGIDAEAVSDIIREGPAWALVDGNSTLGMLTSCAAMDIAIAKARASGIGYVGVRNSEHFGAAGYYANLAAEQDHIGIAMTNGSAVMTVPGARTVLLNNNPIAFAAPTGGRSLLFDASMTYAAAGKILAAAAEGKPIPAGWLLDTLGRSTTDPNWLGRGGSLEPIAEHKGYGLAMLVEVLVAVLTGSAISPEVKSWGVKEFDRIATNTGHAFIAIDIDPIMPIQAFKTTLDGLCDTLRAAPKRADAQRIYIPGEKEWEAREDALHAGIMFPEWAIASLIGLGNDVGLVLDDFVQ